MRQDAVKCLPADLSAFEGVWRIGKTVTDHRSGPDARFEGEACLSPDADGLVYDETGRLTLSGAAPVAAMRRYLWRRSGPGRIAVLFPDGRPFHSFALQPAPRARHWCAPDLYCVSYDFSQWPEWTATWAVSGPRKAYTLVSTYRR